MNLSIAAAFNKLLLLIMGYDCSKSLTRTETMSNGTEFKQSDDQPGVNHIVQTQSALSSSFSTAYDFEQTIISMMNSY